jgi:serine/threonine protein kinase
MQNPLIGYQLANFRVEKLIGRGGMAEVYYGHDLMLHRPVAIKVIDARLRSNSTYAQRFVQEARTIAQWRHENIVQIFFAGEEDSLFYFVMEYIEGLDLSKLLADYGAEETLMPHDDVIHIGKSVANALDFAHQNGVVHRDIKPSNVMIDETGRVALTDFGLALDVNLGSTGKAFGSAYYIAPEQARRSSQAIPQSDLYSLGVILYEMLTGVVPFDDPSPASLALQHLTLPPPSPRTLNPNLTNETETVLLIALSKSAEERYPNGKALINALEKSLIPSTNGHPPTETADLPAKINATPTLSTISVQDKVNNYIAENPTGAEWNPAADALSANPSTNPKRYSWVTLTAAGASLLFLFIFISVAIISMLTDDENPAETNNTPESAIVQAAASDEPSRTAAPTTETTATNMPQPILETAIIQPTATSTSPAQTPATTDISSTPSPTNSPSPTATILYPNGRLIQLLYDDYSFYILNLDRSPIDVASISFEGLNQSGQSAGFLFSGTSWSAFYETLDSGRCNRIETRQAPFYLRPGQCEFYNATVTPIQDDSFVFWSSLNGIASFRVLWDESEIGRCEVGGKICEILLPRL